MNKENPVFCTDCVHSYYRYNPKALLHRLLVGRDANMYCRKSEEKYTEFNSVTGKKRITAAYRTLMTCRMERQFINDCCGPEGKFWVPKHKKDLFTYLKR